MSTRSAAAPSRLSGVVAGCAAMTQHGAIAMIIGSVLPDLIREFSVRESLAGLMLSAGSLGFIVGPLLAGRIIDRRGVRAALLAGFAIEIVVLAAFGVVPAFAVAVALNFLTRVGSSFVETSVNVLPVLLPPAPGSGGGAREGASMMNLMHSFFGVGALASPIAIGLLIQLTGRWRLAFAAGAVLSAALLASTWAVRLPRAPASTQAPRASWGGLARDPFVLAGASALFLYVGAEVGMSSWIVLYLRNRLALAPVAATVGLTLLWVGIMAGRSINSLIARWFPVRALVLAAALGGAAAGYALLSARSAPAAYALLLVFGLLVSGTFPNVVVSVNSRFPAQVGRVTALLAIASSAGALAFHPVIGTLTQVLGSTAIIAVPPTLLLVLAVTYGLATRARAAAAPDPARPARPAG